MFLVSEKWPHQEEQEEQEQEEQEEKEEDQNELLRFLDLGLAAGTSASIYFKPN